MLGRLRDWLNADHSARQNALNASLERIREIDPFIQAWVQVAPQAPAGDGQLYGVPFGVKDVIETKDLVTEFGSPIYKDQKGTADAALVRELRTRGAVLLGKTHTAAQSKAHAWWQLQRISSSGCRVHGAFRSGCADLWIHIAPSILLRHHGI
jgi:Amidase